jgi:hypothetical protein
VHSAPIENKDTFINAIFVRVRPFTVNPGPLKLNHNPWSDVSMRVRIQVENILGIFFVNCDLINNKNTTVIWLGTCIVNVLCQLHVNVLCQLHVNYCIAKIFIVEFKISNKLKNHSFPRFSDAPVTTLLYCSLSLRNYANTSAVLIKCPIGLHKMWYVYIYKWWKLMYIYKYNYISGAECSSENKF